MGVQEDIMNWKVAQVLERLKQEFQMAIYPDIRRDGIGTYLGGINQYLNLPRLSCPFFVLSPLQFLSGIPAGYDLIHVPHFIVPRTRRGVKIVCTIHDVTPLVVSRLLSPMSTAYIRARISWSIRAADHLVFISENTYRDVTRLFGPVPHYSIIPLAAGEALPPESISPVRYEFPFFLCVGRRRGHKNIHGILRAYAEVARQSQCHLIFGGAEDKYDATYRTMAAELGIADRIHFTGLLSSEELAAHYRSAIALLFPSLYEGFGLPILEAMTYGCPVITSNTSSMPEVAGPAALYVDPFDPSSIARAMELLESQPAVRQEFREKGLERVQAFSWKNTAERTCEVYEDVMRRRAP
jgi:glycosyltransferase involved in cell wall biosynthesis